MEIILTMANPCTLRIPRTWVLQIRLVPVVIHHTMVLLSQRRLLSMEILQRHQHTASMQPHIPPDHSHSLMLNPEPIEGILLIQQHLLSHNNSNNPLLLSLWNLPWKEQSMFSAMPKALSEDNSPTRSITVVTSAKVRRLLFHGRESSPILVNLRTARKKVQSRILVGILFFYLINTVWSFDQSTWWFLSTTTTSCTLIISSLLDWKKCDKWSGQCGLKASSLKPSQDTPALSSSEIRHGIWVAPVSTCGWLISRLRLC